MNQHICTVQAQDPVYDWSQSALQKKISGIEDLMASSYWLVLSPLQKKNWRQQLNGLRCRALFQDAYPSQVMGTRT